MEEFVSLVKNSNPSCLSKESGSAMKKVLEQRSRLFALNVPEFVSLSSNDQVVLQEENIGPLIELRVATFFHTGLWWAFQPMTKKLSHSENTIFSYFGSRQRSVNFKSRLARHRCSKEQLEEFILFAFLLFTENKSNTSVRFLGESMTRQSAFCDL